MRRDVTSVLPLRSGERIAYGPDANQFVDIWRPSGAAVGSAVFIHGGFWRAAYDLGHAGYLCAALASNGVATANLEYRRVGQPGGGWPGTFNDVIAGVKAWSAIAGPPLVIGHSAGGHLALRLASESLPLRAVLALAPVADLQLAYQLNLSKGAVVELLGGTPDTVPDRYQAACPSDHAASVRRVVMHGLQDEVVPVSLSQAFSQRRKHDPVPPRLIEIPGADHFVLIDPESQEWPAVRDLVLQQLAGD